MYSIDELKMIKSELDKIQYSELTDAQYRAVDNAKQRLVELMNDHNRRADIKRREHDKL